jgi:EAL domain-containing protein (putative c-di-GMP-specific phosphodiesterase class I)
VIITHCHIDHYGGIRGVVDQADVDSGKTRIFAPEMQQAVDYQLNIEKGLRRALEQKSLELHYQPLVNEKNKIFAVEALLRWQHPEKGSISPYELIEVAERCGLIIPVGEWVIKSACMDFAQITDSKDLTLCINVSPRQFWEPGFVQRCKTIFNDTGINPEHVRFEITENIVIKDLDDSIEKMKALSSIGVSFSVDDFGTGYSSFTYLKRLPVDSLKIDKSFVSKIDVNDADAAIVETIISMAQHLDINIVAEGVETEAILDILKSKGCRQFQGYLFGRPMPLSEITPMISPDIEIKYQQYG